MINEFGSMIEGADSGNPVQRETERSSRPSPDSAASVTLHHAPVIEVFESDGTFNIYADFRPAREDSGADILIRFAQQGMILTMGPVQRYLPIPADAQIEHARVTITDGIVRASIRTAYSGHRWRSIVMW